MENENIFLFYAFLMGIYITFVYDFLRILRRVIPHKKLWIALEDSGFWVYCAVKVFLLMYRESNGNLRWFAVLGALAGILLYRKTVSPLIVKYTALILERCLRTFRKCMRVVFKPLKRVALRGRRSLKKRLTFFAKVLRMIV